jgi:selT/selW/selH-like putative selenoprotein
VVRDSLGVDATIEPGSTGEFTVLSDGDVLFSKHEQQRFPEEKEILEKLRSG